MANMMAYQSKPYRSSVRWCQSGSPPTARLAVEAQRSQKGRRGRWLAVTLMIAGLALVPARFPWHPPSMLACHAGFRTDSKARRRHVPASWQLAVDLPVRCSMPAQLCVFGCFSSGSNPSVCSGSQGLGTLLKLERLPYHQLMGAYRPEKPSPFTMAGSHDYIIATSQARQPRGGGRSPIRLACSGPAEGRTSRSGMAQWDEDMGIGGGLGNPIHHGIAPLTRPCCLFLVSRGLVNAGDGYAEDNTEGHLTHGTPGLDAARPPSTGTGTVSSGWTPSALGPGVAICYLPQQVATGITTPLCLCLASERASFQVAGIGIDKQHFRCQQSKHCATCHGETGCHSDICLSLETRLSTAPFGIQRLL